LELLWFPFLTPNIFKLIYVFFQGDPQPKIRYETKPFERIYARNATAFVTHVYEEDTQYLHAVQVSKYQEFMNARFSQKERVFLESAYFGVLLVLVY
jgi:hypothetical protein